MVKGTVQSFPHKLHSPSCGKIAFEQCLALKKRFQKNDSDN